MVCTRFLRAVLLCYKIKLTYCFAAVTIKKENL